MNRASSVVASVLVVILTGSAHARLGDTLAEAIQHYGPATERMATPPAAISRTFTLADAVVDADFINDVVHRITYRQARAFTDEEIKNILGVNAGPYSWLEESGRLNPARVAMGARSWLRSDRGSATLTRRSAGDVVSETLVITDGVWLAANLKLRLTPKPDSATAPAPAEGVAPHLLTWTNYTGQGDAAAAHLVLDGEDLGRGADGLAALKLQLAKLRPHSVVKVVPYYGDPGAGVSKTPPLDLVQLRADCESHGVTLLIPEAQ